MSKSLISTGIKAIKSTRKLAAMKAAITLTPAAETRVKELMTKNPSMLGLRIGVKQRGCNGLTYTLEFTNEKKKI